MPEHPQENFSKLGTIAARQKVKMLAAG